MSKFFKALEKVEHEREAAAAAEAQAAAQAPSDTGAPVSEPVARPVSAAAAEAPPAPRIEPTRHVEPAPRVEPTLRTEPAPRTEPPPRVEPAPRPEPTPRPEPAPRTEPPPRVEPTPRTEPTPRVEPTTRVEPMPRVEPPPRVEPARRPEPTPRVESVPRVEPAPRVEPVPRVDPTPSSTPFARPPVRPPVYGSPIARERGGRHRFAWQMEPATGTETGDIDDHLVSLLEPTSFAAEQYRAVRLAIETLRHERGTSVVGVASPGRGEGRTMTALNLAGALAQASDARVALVEADLRHPSVAGYLGLPVGRGLSTYLVDTTMTVDDVVQRPASIAFSVLPAGSASSMPYELLKAPRMSALITELRRRYDYVLVDTPSALPFPDVGILRDLVDGFIVVVRANRTPREQLQDTMTVLGRQRTLGLVFNDDDRTGVPAFKEQGEARWRRLVQRPVGAARG